MPHTRRVFLAKIGLALGIGIGGAYTYNRGLRFPPPVFTLDPPLTRARNDYIEVSAEGAIFQTGDTNVLQFRAFVPEPNIVVRILKPGPWEIVVENLSHDARLENLPTNVKEDRDNLNRVLKNEAISIEEHRFNWKLDSKDNYRFAIIGDTGGGLELKWVLQRAAELGASFLLHLGDINYEAGDIARAAKNFNAASIPSYVSIGNHDFYEGLQFFYPEFNRLIGPNNSTFRLGGIEFANFDTATGFLPVASGQRARLFESLTHIDQNPQIRDRVFFTHKPLTDPSEDRDHSASNLERSWLREQLMSLGANQLLAGHVHIKAEFDDQGLQTYISGQGMAHIDLLGQRQLAEILVGDVNIDEPVRYQWLPLNMPYENHCNTRSINFPEILGRPEETKQILELCKKPAG